jgi:hypothetical protein
MGNFFEDGCEYLALAQFTLLYLEGYCSAFWNFMPLESFREN